MRGSEVAVASDGMEAWSKLRKGHFDALITDCEMPKWSGLELLGAARRSADGSIADIPAVLASSVTASDFLERIRELRETFFLPKPIDPEQLIVMLELIQRRRLRQWKQRRERASDTFTRDEREY
jgi:CheY-like chemotaxis protein